MNLSLVIELTILVLAIFLGFEVISKVPTMLHTPLMSGTNAIHGIVIVGAIVVLGEADDTFLEGRRRSSRSCSPRERRRRLRRHRPDARDVQEAPGAEEGEHEAVIALIAPARTCSGSSTSSRSCLLHPRAAFLSSPTHARRGNWIGGVGMAHRDRQRRSCSTAIANWALIVIGAVDRRGRRPRRRAQGEDDRDAADGGAVQRRRRRRGGARRDLASSTDSPAAISTADVHRLDRALGADRLDLLRGLARRLREAAGARSAAGRSPSRASRSSTPRVPRRAAVVLGVSIARRQTSSGLISAAHRCSRSLFGVLFVLPIGGADMPVVISLLNAFTGLAAAATGFVLDEQRADRRRHARRRLGHDPDAADGARR